MYIYDHNGRELLVWPFQPNWSSPFVESLDYLTDVIPAFSGSEQRIQLRTNPRRLFDYVVQANTGVLSSLMSNMLWSWQNKPFALPLWHERSNLTTDVAASTDVLSLTTEGMTLIQGGLLVIFKDYETFEVCEIDTFDSSSITLVDNLANSWLSGVRVYPAVIAYMPESVARQMLSGGVTELSTQFSADASTDPNIQPGTEWSDLSFDGKIVLTKRPNWSEMINLDNELTRDAIEYFVGKFAILPTRTFPSVVKRFQWVSRDKSETITLRKIFGTMIGRLKSLYVPTWVDDFKLTQSAASSATSIVVKSNGFHELIGVNDDLKAIVIFLRNGNYICKEIESTSQGVGTITLGFGSTIGTAINTSNVKMISLLQLNRLFSDRITLSYLTDSVVTVEASFVTVKA